MLILATLLFGTAANSKEVKRQAKNALDLPNEQISMSIGRLRF